jgi:hypothetical protein
MENRGSRQMRQRSLALSKEQMTQLEKNLKEFEEI